jgi:hypothetical protein
MTEAKTEDMAGQDRRNETAEAAIQIATKKDIRLLVANEAEVQSTVDHPIEMSYSKDYLRSLHRKTLAAPFLPLYGP